MKAWKVTRFGAPRHALTLDEAAELPAPGRGQLKVRVRAAGLGLPDVFMCNNTYPLTPALPFIPSQEVVGTVIQLGEGVDMPLGQRVLGPSLFQAQQGGLAQECMMSASSAFEAPDTMSDEEAAGFFIPYQTAWVGLKQRAALRPGETALILGASGSSGSAAVQLAKALGARVIAVAGGEHKVAFCKTLGADEIIDHREQDILAMTLDLTNGKGANVVFDPVGGDAGRAGFDATAFEGRFVVIGFASGKWVKVHAVETVMKNISIVGAMPTGFPSSYYHDAHRQLLDLWKQGKLRLLADQTFDFEQAIEAIEHIAATKVTGKVVVTLPG